MQIIKTIENIVVGVCYKRRGKKYYTVVNVEGEEENHAHFNSYSTACMVARYVNEKKIPKKKSLLIACKRLTTNEIYKERLENNKGKEKYININKGKR